MTKDENNNDEINLLKIFKNFFSSSKKFCLSFFSFVIKHSILLISFILLGIVGGFIHYKISKPIYLSELILSSNYIPNNVCAEMIEHLQEYIDDDTPELLAKKLDINTIMAENIYEIKFENFYPTFKRSKDSINMGVFFRIK